MKIINTMVVSTLAIAVTLSLGACAGMSAQDQNTAVGADVGAVGGAVLTGGSTLGTLGARPSEASSAIRLTRTASKEVCDVWRRTSSGNSWTPWPRYNG